MPMSAPQARLAPALLAFRPNRRRNRRRNRYLRPSRVPPQCSVRGICNVNSGTGASNRSPSSATQK